MLLKGIAAVSAVAAVLICICGGVAFWWLPALFVGAFLVLTLAAFGFLCLVCAFVDMDKPQEHDSPFYRRVTQVYIDALVSLLRVRIHTTGLEKVPTEGRFMLVCNHLFIADPCVLLHCFPKSQLAFVTKQENQKLFVVGKVMHKILCQPIDRENDRAALKTIIKCIQLLKDDEASVAVFPEGYTSKDGKLHHFRSGVFKIAQKANVPIVVCTIRNTRQIFRNVTHLKPTDVELHLVDVIPAEDLKGKTTVDIGNQVYEMMIGDLGESFRAEEA